jgi:hypothetical protein
MSISDTTENAILNLVFRATAWANYADNAASTPETNIVLALHTADPTDSGNQGSSEITYTSYARVNVARSGSGWNAASGTNGTITPVANIDFPAGTAGGTPTATHFSTGKSGGGASAILWSGTVLPNILTGSGITPRLTTATTITLD